MGTRYTEKGQRFEFLVRRIDEAILAQYYVEASSLTYALLEERTYSLLDKLGITYKTRDKLFNCLEIFKEEIGKRNLAAGTVHCDLYDWLNSEFLISGLVDRIDQWRKTRNNVTHDLAKESIAYEELKDFAEEGRKVFREYTALIMRLKRRLN